MEVISVTYNNIRCWIAFTAGLLALPPQSFRLSHYANWKAESPNRTARLGTHLVLSHPLRYSRINMLLGNSSYIQETTSPCSF